MRDKAKEAIGAVALAALVIAFLAGGAWLLIGRPARADVSLAPATLGEVVVLDGGQVEVLQGGEVEVR